jgi:hypothetical protein
MGNANFPLLERFIFSMAFRSLDNDGLVLTPQHRALYGLHVDICKNTFGSGR